MWAAIIGGVLALVSMGSDLYSQKQTEEEIARRRNLEIKGAKFQFSAVEDSVKVMKAANRENTSNMVAEVKRAGAGQSRDIGRSNLKKESTLLSKSEGLTSGRSQGRQMIAAQVQGNKDMSLGKAEEVSMINRLVDAQDKQTNELNTQLLKNWQGLQAVLTTPNTQFNFNVGSVVSSGISGAATGYNFGKSL